MWNKATPNKNILVIPGDLFALVNKLKCGMFLILSAKTFQTYGLSLSLIVATDKQVWS